MVARTTISRNSSESNGAPHQMDMRQGHGRLLVRHDELESTYYPRRGPFWGIFRDNHSQDTKVRTKGHDHWQVTGRGTITARKYQAQNQPGCLTYLVTVPGTAYSSPSQLALRKAPQTTYQRAKLVMREIMVTAVTGARAGKARSKKRAGKWRRGRRRTLVKRLPPSSTEDSRKVSAIGLFETN